MENQLQVIIKDSGLDSTKAKYILDNFQNYFEVAAEWELKAKAIKVVDENQTADMEMARVGRLFLREKRIAVEKARKELKEQSLREGKAIDGIANVLKALIVPIEEYLEQQEKFIEIKEEKKREAMRIEIERKMEEERLAAEKAELERQEKIRLENERLRKEAEIREQEIARERKAQEALLAKERAEAEAKRRAVEEEARKERARQEKLLADERAKAEAEKKLAEEKTRKEKEKLAKERAEKERLEELLKNQIECPKCGHKFQPKRG